MSVNQQQFSNMHDQYRDRLLNSMTAFVKDREEAEDITATAFAMAFEKRNTFRGDSSLYTWVHAIATNEARNRRRSPSLHVSLESIEASDSLKAARPDDMDRASEQRECCPQVWKAFRQVPRIYRRVLTDRFVRGYSVKEIAKRQRVPLGTVLSRIFRAKQLLRAAWEG